MAQTESHGKLLGTLNRSAVRGHVQALLPAAPGYLADLSGHKQRAAAQLHNGSRQMLEQVSAEAAGIRPISQQLAWHDA